VLAGALNQHRFALYIGRMLASQLRREDVLDIRVHHLTELREWLLQRSIGELFLPSLFHPIEQAWSKLKTKLLQAQARTHEALHAAIDWITGYDAKSCFNHCSYHVHRS
jgi:hypothetical protein